MNMQIRIKHIRHIKRDRINMLTPMNLNVFVSLKTIFPLKYQNLAMLKLKKTKYYVMRSKDCVLS